MSDLPCWRQLNIRPPAISEPTQEVIPRLLLGFPEADDELSKAVADVLPYTTSAIHHIDGAYLYRVPAGGSNNGIYVEECGLGHVLFADGTADDIRPVKTWLSAPYFSIDMSVLH